MEFPKYMQQGSRGPHVVLVQAFLAGAVGFTDTFTDGPTQVKFSQDYDEIMVRLAKDFQEDQDENELDADGQFGPATQAVAKQAYGFDFEVAARLIPGTTIFVQPDGSEMAWSNDDKMTEEAIASSGVI